MTEIFEKFKESVEKIKNVWYPDRIIEEKENKIVLLCENGTYLIYNYISLPEELMDNSQMVNMFHDKVMWQWTDDLERHGYSNISRILAGLEETDNPKIKECLKELAVSLQIEKVLF